MLGERQEQIGGTTMESQRFNGVIIDMKTITVIARKLYDHRSNTHETCNVAGQSEYSKVVNELSQLLADRWNPALPRVKEQNP